MSVSLGKVLVVEDDLSVSRALARAIRSLGYDVSTFETGEDLLRCTLVANPAALLLDFHLPGLSGADLIMADVSLDIAKLIDSLEIERISVPVVACGVGNDTQSAVRAIRAGAKEYLPLPPDEELIAAVLEAVAEESQ